MKITDTLRAEHEVILRVLDALESMADEAAANARSEAQSFRFDVRGAADAVEFLGTFADRCHHGKEEDLLFRRLVARGLPAHVGPIAVMLSDHEEGRALRARMSAAVVAARAASPGAAAEFARAAHGFVELLRDHVEKENGVLFPMADGMLSEADHAELELEASRMEHEHMGEGVHERELARAEALCLSRGVGPVLAHATKSGGCCHGKSPNLTPGSSRG